MTLMRKMWLAKGDGVTTTVSTTVVMRASMCLIARNGEHSVTVVLDEGDLNIQSAQRDKGDLEKAWYHVNELEVTSFLGKCFQEVSCKKIVVFI